MWIYDGNDKFLAMILQKMIKICSIQLLIIVFMKKFDIKFRAYI